MKATVARRITIGLGVVLVVVGLAFNTGTGTLSSYGWQVISAICPLGAVETLLATKLLVPRTLIALIAMVVVIILLGKVFCAWICPIPPIKDFFKPRKKLEAASSASSSLSASSASNFCSSCGQQRKKLDSRHLVLGGALLSTLIFGFPVFCLVCPVGLVFGTIIAIWRLVGFAEPTFSLLFFPAVLLIEVLLLKDWCHKFCPLGAAISLLSIPNRLFRPKVDKSKCLRTSGGTCTICAEVCDERIDPHYSNGMNECTKCAVCKEQCPTQAITIPLAPHKIPVAPRELPSEQPLDPAA